MLFDNTESINLFYLKLLNYFLFGFDFRLFKHLLGPITVVS